MVNCNRCEYLVAYDKKKECHQDSPAFEDKTNQAIWPVLPNNIILCCGKGKEKQPHGSRFNSVINDCEDHVKG